MAKARKKKTGFALMPEAKLREVTSKGGKSTQKSEARHIFTKDERRGGNLMMGRFYEQLVQPLDTPTKRKLVTMIEAADLLGISVSTLHRWIRERLLVSVKSPYYWQLMVTVKSIKRLRSRFRNKYRRYAKGKPGS